MTAHIHCNPPNPTLLPTSVTQYNDKLATRQPHAIKLNSKPELGNKTKITGNVYNRPIETWLRFEVSVRSVDRTHWCRLFSMTGILTDLLLDALS
jgi:hypothetical protein